MNFRVKVQSIIVNYYEIFHWTNVCYYFKIYLEYKIKSFQSKHLDGVTSKSFIRDVY